MKKQKNTQKAIIISLIILSFIFSSVLVNANTLSCSLPGKWVNFWCSSNGDMCNKGTPTWRECHVGTSWNSYCAGGSSCATGYNIRTTTTQSCTKCSWNCITEYRNEGCGTDGLGYRDKKEPSSCGSSCNSCNYGNWERVRYPGYDSNCCTKTFNQAQPELGGEHCGDDWTISTNTEIAGVHTGIGTFTIDSGITADIKDYDGTDFGSVEIHAETIDIQGTIDASGSGYPGGGGGGGGAGANGGSAGSGGDSLGNIGSNGGSASGSGGAGGAGGEGLGTQGGSAGSGGTGGDNSKRYDNGNPGSSGTDGKYCDGITLSCDNSQDESIDMGSGAGAGAGAGGGSNYGGHNNYPGGGGGAGGAGGSGGGIIKLYSTNALTITGSILSKGTKGGAGADGQDGDLGKGRYTGGGNGGAGGDATITGTGSGGSSGKGDHGTNGASGGAGGAGAGGGILIKSSTISISGTIDNLGGNDLTTNGGTVKFFCTQTPTIDNQKIFTGRLLKDPVGCFCTPETEQQLRDQGYECGYITEQNCGTPVDLGTCASGVCQNNVCGLITGSFTSRINNTGGFSTYGIATWQDTIPQGTALNIKIRTSDSPTMAGALDWQSCSPITKNTDISSNNCVNDNDQYVQYHVELSSDSQTVTPIFKDIIINYEVCSSGSCTDTCISLGYECGQQTICGSTVNCGTCSTGTCVSGTCTTSLLPDLSTCSQNSECQSNYCATKADATKVCYDQTEFSMCQFQENMGNCAANPIQQCCDDLGICC